MSLRSIVEELAALKTCEEDDRGQCSLASGPYCGYHGNAAWELRDLVLKAREALCEPS